MKGSKFTGGALAMIGYSLLISIVTAITFGIAYPFIVILFYKWEAENTHIEGRKLEFVGKGEDLFLKYLLWMFLTLITFGIYGLWLKVKLMQWKIGNTVFADTQTLVIEN